MPTPKFRAPQHFSEDEEVAKLYACKRCTKTFNDASGLRKHAKIHGEKSFACTHPGCTKAFIDSSKLKRHQLVHTGERPYACDHPGCSKRFSLDFNLKSHKRVHTGEKPFGCKFQGCDKKFAQVSNLKAHEKTHFKVKVQKPPGASPEARAKKRKAASEKAKQKQERTVRSRAAIQDTLNNTTSSSSSAPPLLKPGLPPLLTQASINNIPSLVKSPILKKSSASGTNAINAISTKPSSSVPSAVSQANPTFNLTHPQPANVMNLPPSLLNNNGPIASVPTASSVPFSSSIPLSVALSSSVPSMRLTSNTTLGSQNFGFTDKTVPTIPSISSINLNNNLPQY